MKFETKCQLFTAYVYMWKAIFYIAVLYCTFLYSIILWSFLLGGIVLHNILSLWLIKGKTLKTTLE